MTVALSYRQRGFSLLEMMVAFVVMAFSLGMLYQTSGGVVRSLRDVDQNQKAYMLAQSVLNSRDNVPAAGWNETGQSAGFVWRVASGSFSSSAANSSVPALQQVQIVVAWTDHRGPHQLELETLLPQAKPLLGPER